MKRILSFILALTFVLSFIPVYANEVNQDKIEDINNMTGVLKMVGIIGSNDVITEDPVTRGQFASFLTKAKGINVFLGEYADNSFIDVTDETLYSKEIAIAKDMKLITGYNDNTFRPDNNITVLEAAICFIRALGYSIKAEAIGGYPVGYYEVIRETKLLNGLNKGYGENLTVSDALRLIYNALHTKILSSSGVSNKGVEYSAEDGVTLLYDSFGITYTEGVVNGVDISNLFGENNISPYHILIGDDIYYYGAYDMRDTLGYNVRAYYKNENSKDRIQFAFKNKEKNNETIIEISDVASIADGKLVTEDADGKSKNFVYNTNAHIIYNGANTAEKFSTDIYVDKNGEKLNGTIKLLDNNGDDKADVVFVDAYQNMIVGGVNVDTGIAYDYYDASVRYNLNTKEVNPFVLLYDDEGTEASVNSLKIGTSVVIYESKDDAYQKYTRAYISTEKINGKLESLENTNGKKYVTIEGIEYVLSEYAAKHTPELIVGRTVDITLNYFGEIAKVSYSTEPGDYQFAMLCMAKKPAGFETSFIIKIMDSSASFVTLKTTDKLKVDGKIYNVQSQSDILLSRFKEGAKAISPDGTAPSENYYFQMIKYGINKDGDIKYIDTILDEDGSVMEGKNCRVDNELFFGRNNGSNTYFLLAQKTLGLSVIVRDDSVLYMYPSKGNEQDTSYYNVVHNPFTSTKKQPGIIYFRDTNEGYGTSIFMKPYEAAALEGDISAMNTYIVTKVTETITKDGDKAKKLYLYDQGTREELIVDEELQSANVIGEKVKAKDILPGDIIYFEQDSISNEINMFLMMYSYENNKIYDTYNTYNEMFKAEVINSTAEGALLHYDMGLDNNGNPKISEVLYNVNAGAGAITVFNTERNTVRAGSAADIIGKDNDPENYTSHMVVRRYQPAYQVIREVYIYK